MKYTTGFGDSSAIANDRLFLKSSVLLKETIGWYK